MPTLLTVSTERTPRGSVIRLRGELDMTNSGGLRLVFDGLLESGPQDIEVDMSELTFTDCAGAAALVSAHNRLTALGHKLTLRAPQPIVRRLFAATGLDEFLLISKPATGIDELC